MSESRKMACSFQLFLFVFGNPSRPPPGSLQQKCRYFYLSSAPAVILSFAIKHRSRLACTVGPLVGKGIVVPLVWSAALAGLCTGDA